MEIDNQKVDKIKIHTLVEDFAGYSTPFFAQHGVSFSLQVKGEDATSRNILFDTGTDATPILHNADLMGVNIKEIDTIFLSHCHYDHTGGLLQMLELVKKDDIPIVAHPEIFRVNLTTDPYLRHAGVSGETKIEAEKLGGIWTLTRDPLKLTNGIITTGEISLADRVEYEKKSSSKRYTLQGGKLASDNMLDDMSLAVVTPHGLVVVTGCSHAGIVSIVRKCKSLTQIDKVRAVIGGFHLLHADQQKIDKVIEGLRGLKVEEIHAGHCTGFKAECRLSDEFGDNFHKLQCGKTIEF